MGLGASCSNWFGLLSWTRPDLVYFVFLFCFCICIYNCIGICMCLQVLNVTTIYGSESRSNWFRLPSWTKARPSGCQELAGGRGRPFLTGDNCCVCIFVFMFVFVFNFCICICSWIWMSLLSSAVPWLNCPISRHISFLYLRCSSDIFVSLIECVESIEVHGLESTKGRLKELKLEIKCEKLRIKWKSVENTNNGKCLLFCILHEGHVIYMTRLE